MELIKLDAVSLENLPYDDLETAIATLLEERTRREQKELEQDWLKVRKAINEYLNKYSEITVTCGSDTIWLQDGNIDTIEIGVIDCR